MSKQEGRSRRIAIYLDFVLRAKELLNSGRLELPGRAVDLRRRRQTPILSLRLRPPRWRGPTSSR